MQGKRMVGKRLVGKLPAVCCDCGYTGKILWVGEGSRWNFIFCGLAKAKSNA